MDRKFHPSTGETESGRRGIGKIGNTFGGSIFIAYEITMLLNKYLNMTILLP